MVPSNRDTGHLADHGLGTLITETATSMERANGRS